MKVDKRILFGILLLGSCWGLLEAVMGSALKSANLPYGVLMSAMFAVPILVMSKLFFNRRGTQAGIGLVAGSLAFFNPWVGCSICSAIAIAAEGFLFGVIWNAIEEKDFRQMDIIQKASLGVVSAFGIFVGGYIITQILTPLTYGNFHVTNLLTVMPQILSQGLLAALIGGVTVSATLAINKLDISIRDTLYYPTTMGVSALCWLFVVGNWLYLAV